MSTIARERTVGFVSGRIILLMSLLVLLVAPATVEGQSEAELRLAVERARLMEEELESELEVAERLAEEGLNSEVEVERARHRLERARLDTEMARAALTGALPPARLLSATRRSSRTGQPVVVLTFERTGTAAQRFGQAAVVSVLSEGLIVGRPFQALLSFPPGGRPTATLHFDLIRDVDQITVVTVSGTRRDEVQVPLEIDATGVPIRLSSLNSSQDGQLGESVDFDVVVERGTSVIRAVALDVDGLPESFGFQVLDQGRSARLRLVQFPQGVNRIPVVLRIDVPQQEDAAWSGRVIDLPVRVRLPDASETLASVVLHLRTIGRPDLGLVSEVLSSRVAPGSMVEIPVDVVNHGRATAFDVQLRLAEPIGLRVEADPRRIAEIPAGDRATVMVRARPRPEAVEGDYQVRMNALTARGGGYAESSDLALRVTVHREPPWGLAAGLLVALGVVLVALWWWRRGRHQPSR